VRSDAEVSPASTTPASAGHAGVRLRLTGALEFVNGKLLAISMVAIVAASLVLSVGVVLRYFLKVPTDWQDEMLVFLLVGCQFLCGAYVQSYRGHVGIEAVASVLPPRVNHYRMIFAEAASAAFCIFFSWKSWTLFHEAVVEHQTTTSTWSPPLAIPYGLMSVGMTLLSLEIVLQLWARLSPAEAAK